jgi:putative transposase
MWNLPAPPGFLGLRDDVATTNYMRHLPHWRQEGATYFVTFRLGDSLPQGKLRELAAVRDDWERRHPRPRSGAAWEEISREVMRRVEAWLDQGMGSCALQSRTNATIVRDALHHFDGQRYELASYVIMPNHVHALVRPLAGDRYPLESILQSWKRFTANRINADAGPQIGAVWQEESFDRIVRDEEHLYRCMQYIGTNPTRAKLRDDEFLRWIQPKWEEIGWRFCLP